MAKIKSAFSNRALVIQPMDSEKDLLHMAIDDPEGDLLTVNVRKADLLAAIEAEGIGVVVEGPVPKVTPTHTSTVMVGRYEFHRHEVEGDLDFTRALIVAHRHFNANPPEPEVDEADVEALRAVFDQTHTSWDSRTMARHLIASGRVTVTR